jgi:hypothetical protein
MLLSGIGVFATHGWEGISFEANGSRVRAYLKKMILLMFTSRI